MNKDKALKMAIAELEKGEGWMDNVSETIQACKEAIVSDVTDIDVGEIAQPPQEPLSDDEINKIAIDCGFQKRFDDVVVKHSNGSWVIISEKLRKFADEIQKENLNLSEKQYTFSDKQPAQEPVVFSESDLNMFQDNAERYNLTTAHPAPSCQECENLKHDLEGYMDANKALINREWQGLSDDETQEIIDNLNNPFAMIRVAEMQLKEKNHG